MSRSTRLRKLPLRYRTEDPPAIDRENPSGRTKIQKGNEIIKNDVLVSLRSPVLRDRTNLNVQIAKVDVKKVAETKKFKKNDKSAPPKTTAKRDLKNKEKQNDIIRRRGMKDENGDGKINTVKTATDSSQAKQTMSLDVEKSAVPSSKSTKNLRIKINKAEKLSGIPRPTRSTMKITNVESDSSSERQGDQQNTNKSAKKSNELNNNAIGVIRKGRIKKQSSVNDNTSPAVKKSSRIGSIKARKSIISPRIISSRSLRKWSNKSITKPERKFFKTKKNVSQNHSKISPMRRSAIKVKKTIVRKRKSSTGKLYQPTLQESFARAKKSLRPRNVEKNYNEQSIIIDKKKEKAGNEGEKLKGPVYKTLNIEEEKVNDISQVYEFSFDANDSKEHLPVKRKKKTVRKAPAKRAKINIAVVKKHNVNIKNPEKAETEKTNENVDKAPRNRPEYTKQEPKPTEVQNDNVIMQMTSQQNSPVDEIAQAFTVNAIIHAAPPSQTEQRESTPVRKATIVSDERLEGKKRISLTCTPIQSNEDRPLRKLNPFTHQPSSQYKTMMNHSLIRRSFSPIVKENNNEKFDANSPWRPFAPATFTNVKNVFQSTPHAKKFLTPHGISSLAMENKRTMSEINNIIERNDKNDKSSIVSNTSPQKSPRKFGTVLSNIDSSPTISSRISSGNENNSSRQNKENSPSKRNSIPRKKSLLKKRTIALSNVGRSFEKKIYEPQPGPSGLQKLPRIEEKVLRQSNLNNFLNIPEMPASTTITTAHGIFNDTHSTPIPGKPVKKIIKNFDITNAFGFEEDNTFDLSSIREYCKENPAETSTKARLVPNEIIQQPIRLPIRKVQVLTDKDYNKIDIIPKKKTSNKPLKKDSLVTAEEFENTFNANDIKESTAAEVPLFFDPEPVHFKEAPRYSYSKRKRIVKFDTSGENEDECTDSQGDEDEDDEENGPRHRQKKKKMTKAAKEQQKQLNEWAKNLNETFNEIDNFDLIVE